VKEEVTQYVWRLILSNVFVVVFSEATVRKQPAERRSSPQKSELEKSILAEAGYSAEYLDALMENISSEGTSSPESHTRNSTPHSQSRNSPKSTPKYQTQTPDSSSQEETTRDDKPRTLSEYFSPKPSSSSNETIRNGLDNSTNRVSVLSLLEEQEREENSAVKKRTGSHDPDSSLIETALESSEESTDQNAKRPKWPKPPSPKRKISDYFGIVQS